MEQTGKSLSEVLAMLASQGGLLGLTASAAISATSSKPRPPATPGRKSPWTSSPPARGTTWRLPVSWAAPT